MVNIMALKYVVKVKVLRNLVIYKDSRLFESDVRFIFNTPLFRNSIDNVL